MAAYWESDGVDDQLQITGSYAPHGANNFTSFEADIMVIAREDWHVIVNFAGKNINYSSNTNNVVAHADYDYVQVNGVTVTLGTAFIPLGTRITLRGVLKAGITTGSGGSAIFSNTVSQFLRARLYGLKMYQGATLALKYDPALGHLNDTTGNGRNGVVTGGSFGDDGPSSTAHTATGSASSTSAATVAASQGHRATAAATSSSASTASARLDRFAFGSASSGSGASATATRGHKASGTSTSNSTVSAGASQGHKATGVAFSVSTAQASSSSGAAHTASGEAISASSATAAGKRSAYGIGASQSTSSASTTARRAATSSGGATSHSTSTAAAIRLLVAAGSAESFSAAEAMAFFVNPDVTMYQRTVAFKVELTRSLSFKSGIVRRKRYDIKW